MRRAEAEKESLLGSGSRTECSLSSLSYGSIRLDVRRTADKYKFLCTKRDTVVVVVSLTLACVTILTTLVIGLPKLHEKQLQYYDTSFAISASPLKTYRKAAVIADGILCASIGRKILEQNGSAVDAAIATLFCNGVVTPESMGLGGGFFMIVYSKELGSSRVIDARETAPAAATGDMFQGNMTLSQLSGLSVAVPGELKGYWAAHQEYGKLPWMQLVEPAINISLSGFEVSHHMASKLELLESRILSIPSLRKEFFNNDTGKLYKEGEIIKRPDLAATLQEIAKHGADVLYNGKLTDRFVHDIKECGGIITKEDLKNYKVNLKDSLKLQLKGASVKELHTVPPPSSGAILGLILNILQGYELSSESMKDLDNAVLTYHRMVEAFKFSFAVREVLADEDFINVTDVLPKLLSEEYADEIRQKISDTETYDPSYYEAVVGSSKDHGTSHVSVLAPNGDAVAATSTVNTYFGSLCRSASTGIILNNDMDDFSSPNITNYFGVPPFTKNFIQPGKRPLSSMSPSIVVNKAGDVEIVIGGMGGTHIVTSLAQALTRLLWLNATSKEAVDALKLHHQLLPNILEYEESFPQVYLDRLKKFGHDVKKETMNSALLVLARRENQIEANVDYRKGGSSDGF